MSLEYGQRHLAVIELRNAALQLLNRAGERNETGVWFQRHTSTNPEPRLAVLLTKIGGYPSLNVWANLRGKHVKVLNASLLGEAVGIVSFRRGDWENELRAMGRVPGMPVN